MRGIYSWIFHLGLVGASLFNVQHIIGQGTRELIDLTPKQTQQPATAPAAPGSNTTPSGRGLIPSLPNSTTGVSPLSLGNPSNLTSGKTAPISLPSMSDRIWSDSRVAPFPALPGSGLPENPEKPIAADPLAELIASFLEEETEDDRNAREMMIQKQRAEQMTDTEQRQTELLRIATVETNYKNRLARRQMNETGANLFYFPRLKEKLLNDGWCQLFDGHTDYGWKTQTEGPYAGGQFKFGQHEICSDPYYPGLIYTQIPFGDVTVRFNYWAEKNSEAYLLMKTPPNPADLNTSCYAFVLNSRHPNRPRGIPLGRHGLSLQPLREMRELWDKPSNDEEGTWHSITVEFARNDYRVWLDKRPPDTYFDPKPIGTGHIALLVTKGRVRFQNFLWKPSQSLSVFNEENVNTTLWRISEGTEFNGDDESGFRLHSGSIESREAFSNSVLQMQYMQGTSSGLASLFIRSLAGQKGTGYEISLQNSPRRQDRESGMGVDAGAFRQFALQYQEARYLRLADRQWTHLTVMAMDKQLQTWVNGVPVSDIEDNRKFLTTTGPFLESGVIRLSVPSENTSFQFRQLMVSPIRP